MNDPSNAHHVLEELHLNSTPEDVHTRLMLVDDQAIVAEALRRMVAEEADIDYFYCSDPSQALEKAIEFQPTVILQDLVMPGINGLTLLRHFKSNASTRGFPVIVLSTKEEPAVKSEAFGIGAADYLVKFPDKIEVLARIRAHSRSFLAQHQRDLAYQALRELQSELEEKNAELQRLSSQDGLTELANRRTFDEFLQKEWTRASRESTCLSLILIDIDHFKTYNDNYGHQGGDSCLRKVAQTLDETVGRPSDLVARYGGEEFVVVMPSTDEEGAVRIAALLRENVAAMAEPHAYSSTADHVTISLGVATVKPTVDMAPERLIHNADEALYEAKEQGRNRYRLYSG